MSENPDPSTPLNLGAALRRCFWLCLPAMIIGAALRLSLMWAIPEAYYGSDSNSYFETTGELWSNHHFELKSKRRWIYPLLLTATPLFPGRTVTVIAAAQHLLGVATLFGIGWVVMNCTRRPQIWVPLITLLASIWPRMLWHEHEIIADTLFLATVVLAAALAFPEGSLKRPRRLFWFLIATTLIVAVKPHGRPIWLGLLIAAVLIAGVPWRWEWRNIAAAIGSVVVMLSSGSSQQGAWLLLSSALPVVKTEGAKWAEYREVLKPYIEEARADISQYPWKQSVYKKMLAESKGDRRLGPQWSELRDDRQKFSKVANGLAVEGIFSSPFTYAKLVMLKTGMVISDDDVGERLVPEKFWKEQESNNEDRWGRSTKDLMLLYELDRDGYRALVAERSQRKIWFEPYLLKFTKATSWTKTVGHEIKRVHPRWMGLLALLGFLACFRPSRWRATSPLWLSLTIYMVIIFSVGDVVSRYLLPVEWIGFVFIALGLDWMLQLILPEKKLASAPLAANASAEPQL